VEKAPAATRRAAEEPHGPAIKHGPPIKHGAAIKHGPAIKHGSASDLIDRRKPPQAEA